MLRDAYAIARQFTWPVVISRRTNSGQCTSGMGSFVIVNKEGWIVTAWHLIAQLVRMIDETKGSEEHERKVAAINADSSLKPKEKSKALAKVGKLSPDQTRNCSWELKHDGYRALLIKDGERVSLQTRNGNELLQFFPEIAADMRKLPDCAIDGELVMLDDKGKPEFHQLRGRCAMPGADRIGRAAVSKPAAVFAFDLLQLLGKDLRQLPLLKRKAALHEELSRTERIVYCQHVGESGEKLFLAAEQLGLEGVIGKKADSPYRAGRTPNWVKVKTSHGRHIDDERAKWNE